MKKVTMVAITLLAFISCGQIAQQSLETPPSKENIGLEVHVIDSCEYITYHPPLCDGVSVIHKQNCKYCLQRK